MTYIEKFVEAYFKEGLREANFENVGHIYPIVYGELRRKDYKTLEFWLEDTDNTGHMYQTLKITIDIYTKSVLSIIPNRPTSGIPLVLQAVTRQLLRAPQLGWLIRYIDF